VAKALPHTGAIERGAQTTWAPLVRVVGENMARDFMWMFEVALECGVSVQAYKHIETRRYLHLNSDGVAYHYEPPDRYRIVPIGQAVAVTLALVARQTL
jgi:hypothetical protein